MIPEHIQKYFWGDDLAELDWEKHKDYIAKMVLEKGDIDAVEWLFGKTNKDYLRHILEIKKLDPKSENYWKIYLA